MGNAIKWELCSLIENECTRNGNKKWGQGGGKYKILFLL